MAASVGASPPDFAGAMDVAGLAEGAGLGCAVAVSAWGTGASTVVPGGDCGGRGGAFPSSTAGTGTVGGGFAVSTRGRASRSIGLVATAAAAGLAEGDKGRLSRKTGERIAASCLLEKPMAAMVARPLTATTATVGSRTLELGLFVTLMRLSEAGSEEAERAETVSRLPCRLGQTRGQRHKIDSRPAQRVVVLESSALRRLASSASRRDCIEGNRCQPGTVAARLMSFHFLSKPGLLCRLGKRLKR